MTSTALEEFGYAVRKARLDLGWTLEELAEDALENGARKGYVGQIEKGKRSLSPETIDKFDQALTHPDDVVKAAHLAPKIAAPSAEDDKVDYDAERLINRADHDPTLPQMGETLMVALAYEFAGGQYVDLHTAYTSLRAALEAAENIRKRGEMPPENTGSQLNAVLAEVAKLNALGERNEADALLDQEERRMEEAHKADADRREQQANTLLTQRLDQDRLRNRPDLAAERIIKNLRQFPQGGKLFWAINDKSNEWRDQGDKSGDLFALRVGLEIAKSNYENHKTRSGLAAAALRTLGRCHLRLAERLTNERHLKVARNAFEASIQKTSKAREPLTWSARQEGLGQVLLVMGQRAADVDLLRKSVSALRVALDVDIKHKSKNIMSGWNNLGSALSSLGELTRDTSTLTEAVEALQTALVLTDVKANKIDWAGTQGNVALAQRYLGDVPDDLPTLNTARQGYGACEALDYQTDAPFKWAVLQWNIADLALARYRLDPDPALLSEAKTYVTAARAFFVDGSDHQTERCDDLLTQIKAAEAARP
jgi:transcriptional regulator with XRE-family HTH domain